MKNYWEVVSIMLRRYIFQRWQCLKLNCVEDKDFVDDKVLHIIMLLNGLVSVGATIIGRCLGSDMPGYYGDYLCGYWNHQELIQSSRRERQRESKPNVKIFKTWWLADVVWSSLGDQSS